MSLISYPIIKSFSPYIYVSKSIFQALHTGISSTLSIIRILNKNSNLLGIEPFNNFLIKSDLLVKLEIFDLLLIDLNNKKLLNSILACLDKISTLIKKIKKSLEEINVKINNHCNKYLYYYRNLDLNNELICLENDSLLLNTRIDLLLKLLKVNFN